MDARIADTLGVPVMIGVGAAFDYLAGTKPRRPEFLRHVGLEWLFRLAVEPKRLWRRYLVGNSTFVYLVVRERLSRAGPTARPAKVFARAPQGRSSVSASSSCRAAARLSSERA